MSGPEDDLKFDRAEFGAQDPSEGAAVAPVGSGPGKSGAACAGCRLEIAAEYYSLPGTEAVFCERCREEVIAQHGPNQRFARVTRASIAGVLAGIAGCLLYYAVARITGFEIGLVAVVVGFMVGSAVRWGSFARGGWFYQLLAVGITYIAIVGTVIPVLIEEIQNNPDFQTESEDPGAESESAEVAPASALEVVVGLALLLAFALALPILSALEAPIWLLIIGFAIFEAWKRNRRMSLAFEGPFRLGSTGTPPAEIPS